MLTDETLNSVRSEIFVRLSQQNPLALQDLANHWGVFRQTAVEALNDRFFHEHQAVLDEALDAVMRDPYGFGPVFELISDKTVTDIWINNYRDILYEGESGRRVWPRGFGSEEAVRRLAERLALASGRRADETNPAVDCRLFDGSRVSVMLAPLPSVRGTSITIRKFPRLFTLEDLAKRKLFPAEFIRLFELAVKARLNVAVAGGMGSGKNTFMTALLLCAGKDENLVLVEDPAESRLGLPDPERPDLPQPFVRVYEPRPANAEGRGGVSLEDIFERALRQRPDRLIVSEARSGVTARYALEAMDLGHPGSMFTVHAEAPEEVPFRLARLLGGVNPGNLQRAAALEIVFFLAQLKAWDGRPAHRRLLDICEVRKKGDGTPEVVPLFAFDFRGYAEEGEPVGELRFVGNKPEFLGKRKVGLFLTGGEKEELEKFFLG